MHHTHTGGMYSVYSEKRNNSVHTRWCRRSFLENRRGTQRVFLSTERTTTVDNAQCNKEFYFFLVSKGESGILPAHHSRPIWDIGGEEFSFVKKKKRNKNEKLFLHPLEIHAHAKMSPSLGALRKRKKKKSRCKCCPVIFFSHFTPVQPHHAIAAGQENGDRLHGWKCSAFSSPFFRTRWHLMLHMSSSLSFALHQRPWARGWREKKKKPFGTHTHPQTRWAGCFTATLDSSYSRGSMSDESRHDGH